MRTITWWRSRAQDDSGSMPLAMLVSLVAISISTLMSPMVINQFGSTKLDIRRVHALHAAQSGLDIAMGHLRAATNATGKGLLERLPCGPYEGTVGSDTARYKVWIDYFRSDPAGKWDPSKPYTPQDANDDPWIRTTSEKITCDGGLLETPTYALFRAVGTDDQIGFPAVHSRFLHGTYRIKTNNSNISGGLIHVFQSTLVDLCMDAGSGSPTAGTLLRMRRCTPGSINQLFSYNSNLTITLVASRTTTNPLGLCLDAGPNPAAGAQLTFQQCGASTLPQQQWNINDNANYEGTRTTGTLSGRCMIVENPDVDGSNVIMGNNGCGGPYNNVHTWSIEPSVGAGAAGPATAQLVNFRQFGRCLDVTEGLVSSTYLIVWPCKQAPNPANVLWNQKFTVPAVDPVTRKGTGRVVTLNKGVTPYCLSSPGSTAYGNYVRVKSCPAITTPEYTWTYYGKTESYATSYVMVDSNGYCLTPTIAPDLYPKVTNVQISKVAVAVCDGSTLQKWNAPANLLQPLPLKDIGER
jgi:hypothetical protein